MKPSSAPEITKVEIDKTNLIRLWNTSRTCARRISETSVAEVRELLSKMPPEYDNQPIASLLSLTGACEIINDVTDKIAGYPSRAAIPSPNDGRGKGEGPDSDRGDNKKRAK